MSIALARLGRSADTSSVCQKWENAVTKKSKELSSATDGEPNLKVGCGRQREVKRVDEMDDAFFHTLDGAVASYDQQGSQN
ncbi:hypothetical protein [Sulfitobacter geojensis]|uniref:hypothetical protein n=1 Tax=Sulfitobacter geojensis TaxID=1342299 RepID=UPI003BAB6902